jgi:5-methylcytosine-specific restriction endonuclease McrA
MSPIRPESVARYPSNWREISLRIRTVRAAGRCECVGECGVDHDGRCTAENGQPHPVTGSKVVLTTAHRDHTPENVDDANLFAACQRCHLRYDRDHHRATRAATRRAAAEAGGQLTLTERAARKGTS